MPGMKLSDSALKDVEAYFGWVSQGSSGPIVSSRVPPTVNAGSPLILGARADINPVDALQLWVEGAYEFGADGGPPAGGIPAVTALARFSSTWAPSTP